MSLEVDKPEELRVGTSLYQAIATDEDGDAVFFTMETVPDSDLFSIGRSESV